MILLNFCIFFLIQGFFRECEDQWFLLSKGTDFWVPPNVRRNIFFFRKYKENSHTRVRFLGKLWVFDLLYWKRKLSKSFLGIFYCFQNICFRITLHSLLCFRATSIQMRHFVRTMIWFFFALKYFMQIFKNQCFQYS